MDKELKLQILVSQDNIDTHALKAEYVAYGNLGFLGVITHLKSNYYKISPVSLKDNAACITAAYDINQSFGTIFDQIEMSVDFSGTRKVTYTPYQVATTAYDLIFSIRYFTDACCL